MEQKVKKENNKMAVDIAAIYGKKIVDLVDHYKDKTEFWRYLELCLSLFTTVFFIITAIRPAVITIAGLYGEIKQKDEINEIMRNKVITIIAAQDNYASLNSKISLLEGFLPSDPALYNAGSQILGMVVAKGAKPQAYSISGVNLYGVAVQSSKVEKTDSTLKAVDFDLGVKGEYPSLKSTIGEILNTRRWIDLDQYSFNRIDKKIEGEIITELNLSIAGKYYYWPVSY